MQRWLLDTPVVLYRREDGTAAALYDRCPHRWAPLSAGTLEGDNLVCPYHGACFNPAGQAVRFPAAAVVPKSLQVRSFATAERGPFIWIWMGDDGKREQAPLPPDYAWSNNEGWAIATGNFDFKANYMLLHENVLDLTHFNYVHAKSFKILNWTPAPKMAVDGNVVRIEDTMVPSQFTPEERIVMGMGHPDCIRMEFSAWFETPALHRSDTFLIGREGGAWPDRTVTHVAHMVTPASPGETHYWWMVGTDAPMPDAMRQSYGDFIRTGYLEDKVMLESIQQLLTRDRQGMHYPEVSVQSDGAGLQARRALQRLLAMEAHNTRA